MRLYLSLPYRVSCFELQRHCLYSFLNVFRRFDLFYKKYNMRITSVDSITIQRHLSLNLLATKMWFSATCLDNHSIMPVFVYTSPLVVDVVKEVGQDASITEIFRTKCIWSGGPDNILTQQFDIICMDIQKDSLQNVGIRKIRGRWQTRWGLMELTKLELSSHNEIGTTSEMSHSNSHPWSKPWSYFLIAISIYGQNIIEILC